MVMKANSPAEPSDKTVRTIGVGRYACINPGSFNPNPSPYDISMWKISLTCVCVVDIVYDLNEAVDKCSSIMCIAMNPSIQNVSIWH